MSTTWVALLRGINLGANNRVPMADLRELLESRGYHDVRTYLQSGNALFTVGRTAAATMERTIASAIKRELGVETVVLVRSAAEIATVVEHNPFAGRRGVDPKRLHAVFLSKAPARAATASIDMGAFAPSEYAFGKRVVYARLPRGVIGSPMPNWERMLGVRATMRSWAVVLRIHEMSA
jgi:uncharacterized protein (DUF1697 family)